MCKQSPDWYGVNKIVWLVIDTVLCKTSIAATSYWHSTVSIDLAFNISVMKTELSIINILFSIGVKL